MKAFVQRKPIEFMICFIMFFTIFKTLIFAEGNDLQPITAQDFVKPIWYQHDVIINAGDLGRYSFSGDKDAYEIPKDVKIRPELIELLNNLQSEFNTPMIIMSGYRSQRQDLYLWARWLDNHPEYIKATNEKGFKNWEEWIQAVQELKDSPPLSTKYQTGDAVDFYWKGLELQTERKRDILVALINELGGQRRFTDEEREKYNIAPNDNNLLKATGYMRGESVNPYNPWGKCYFHVEYQPSPIPPKPDVDAIGRKLSPLEDMALAYKKDEIVLIQEDDYMYLAKVIEDCKADNVDIQVQIFCDEIKQKLGDKVSKSLIATKREKPKNGWGTRKVMLEYRSDGEWKFAMDVIEFEDYYLVPIEDEEELKVTFEDIRIPIPRIHGN